MSPSTPTHRTLALIHGWITREGAHTDSARVLRRVLLSLAGRGEVALFSLQVLDGTRRGWLAEVIRGLGDLTPEELLSAAGGVERA